jgi:hypothetical protein
VNAKQMIEQVRAIIARCDASEKDAYEALLEEAEGWKMRLEELEDEE